MFLYMHPHAPIPANLTERLRTKPRSNVQRHRGIASRVKSRPLRYFADPSPRGACGLEAEYKTVIDFAKPQSAKGVFHCAPG